MTFTDADRAASAGRKARRPRKYIVNERCSAACTLSDNLLPGDMFTKVHSWIEAGANRPTIVTRAAELGVHLSEGAIGRHFSKHLTPEDQMHTMEELEATAGQGPKLGDVDILERLIDAGAKNLADKKVRVSPEMLMKAMELKYKLTQGNVFQGFMDAVNQAMDPAVPAPEGMGAETVDAVRSEDEQAQASPE